MKIFAQLAKIDEARHEVWGVATAEVVDKEGEIFDYESSKPYFKSWSDEIAKATDGRSLGNVREMHEPSAVGKLVALDFDDELKEIRVGARIIDSVAWQKCSAGVYTGFSIGGAYVKTWQDGDFTRFTAKPVEISIVDNPCVPDAHFTAVKADGSCEVRKFSADLRSLWKIGAKHSKETLAHLDAIQSCLQTMAECHDQASGHMDALLAKDDDLAALIGHAGLAKYSGDDRLKDDRLKMKTGEQHTMLDPRNKEQLEKASANSTSALSKVVEVEKSVTGLRNEMEHNNQEIQASLANLLSLMEKLVSPKESTARVARAAVPTFTVRKEDEGRAAAKAPEVEKSVHELMKLALQNPQRASNYLG